MLCYDIQYVQISVPLQQNSESKNPNFPLLCKFQRQKTVSDDHELASSLKGDDSFHGNAFKEVAQPELQT